MATKLPRKKRLALRETERQKRTSLLERENAHLRRLDAFRREKLAEFHRSFERLETKFNEKTTALEQMTRRAEDAERKFRENVLFVLTADVPKEPTLWGGRYMLDLSYSFFPVRAVHKIEQGPRQAAATMMLDCEHSVRHFLRELESQLYPVLKQFMEQRYPREAFRPESRACETTGERL